VEHYLWEPQHLLKTLGSRVAAKARGETLIATFYRTIRSQEVPLNLLFNVFLRLAPARVRTRLLSGFAREPSSLPAGPMCLVHAEEQKYIQPDVLLESDTERVLIEMKVGHHLTLDQVRRYCLLHAARNLAPHYKIPFLYFLTRGRVHENWHPESAKAEIREQGLEAYLRPRLAVWEFEPGMLAKAGVTKQQVSPVLSDLRIGVATWQEIGDVIAEEATNCATAGGDLAEVMTYLTGDFLADMERRSLWHAPSATSASEDSPRAG